MAPRWFEIEMEQLERDLDEGLITQTEFNAVVREMVIDLDAEEAGEPDDLF